MRSEVTKTIIAILLVLGALGLLAATDAHGAQPTAAPAPGAAPVPRAHTELEIVVVRDSPLAEPIF